MWPLDFVPSLRARKKYRSAQPPSRARVTLNLETLEERWLPNGTVAAPSTSPPSFTQAAISLFTDGIDLGIGLVNQNVFHIDEIDAFPIPPAVLNANISFNAPYVGAFAPLFVLAGQIVGAEVQYQVQINSLQTF